MRGGENMKDEKEKLRLEDVKEIAENWDKIPAELRGELAGTVRTMKRIYVDRENEEKAG